MKFKYIEVIILLLLFNYLNAFGQHENVSTTKTDSKPPKNIILLIGDGMGLSQVSAGIFYNDKPSNFERFTTIGLSKTSVANSLVTDSAASATALASGIKTYNGAIGVNIDTLSVETIVEVVSKMGLSTGIIATSSITHATPACFYAHVASRRLENEIANFLPTSDIDFFAGGGLKYFEMREDGRNLLKELKDNGFELNISELPQTTSAKKQAILLADDEMPKMANGRGDFLPNATKLALQTLTSNENGFFLMVEGSQIDWGGHANDAEYLIKELLDFDKTIGVALDFASENGETLVIVTADHETGGFTLAQDDGDYNKILPTFSTKGHSATMVPVFAKGPGSSVFVGIYEISEVYFKMTNLFSK